MRRWRWRRGRECDAGLQDSGLDREQLITDSEAEEAQMERCLQGAAGECKLASPQPDGGTSINLPEEGPLSCLSAP